MRMNFLGMTAALGIGAIAMTGCTATEQGAAIGAGTGAVIGGATTGTVQGAAIGGAIGAGVGALIGRTAEPGRCLYRDRYGREYVAACPR